MNSLFLGFPMNESFDLVLRKNKPEYLALFIQPGSAYLEEIHFQGISYLGKSISNEESLIQLELIETHIWSLLKKLVPDYDYVNSNLVLFALPQSFNLKTAIEGE